MNSPDSTLSHRRSVTAPSSLASRPRSLLLPTILAATACAGLWLSPAVAGTIAGRVTNQATGDALAGAIVAVEGSTATAIAERDGTYSLSLPDGPQTLLVSYIGLDTSRVPVVVGGSTARDVSLTSNVYTLEAVSVKGVREGNALALQTQRNSENPKWVVATDTFGNPAANPGELIQRLPGISTDIVGSEVRTLYVRGMGAGFSSLLVDGDRMASSGGTSATRDYQIEQLGTGNLETVELIKAPRPEQDANAVAGFINLVSKRAFDAPGRRITFTAGVMWRERHDMDGSPFKDRPDGLDIFSVGYSDVFSVFGGKRNLGIAANFSRRVSATTQDEAGPGGVLYNFAQTYLNPNTTNPLTRVFGSGDIGYKAIAMNSGIQVDYKFSPNAYVYFGGALNSNDQYQQYYRPGIGDAAATAASFSADSTYGHSIMLPHAASVAISESTPAFTKDSRNFALRTGGEVKLPAQDLKLELRGSYSHADISYPGWIRAQSRTTNATGIGFEIDRRGQDPWYPIFNQTAGPSIYDASSYTMDFMQKQSYKSGNDIYSLRGDVTKTIPTAYPLKLKAGAKWDDDTRNPQTTFGIYTFVGKDGLPRTADDVMTPYADLNYKQSEGRYGPFPFMTHPQDAPTGYWQQTADNVYNSYATSNAGNARFEETISAGYLQGSMKIGKFGFLTGLRLEHTETKGTAWTRNTTATFGGNNTGGTSLDPAIIAANLARAQRSFVRRNTSVGKYDAYFPGLHLTYEALPNLIVRASYNRSISRPPIANLIPTVTENQDAHTISVGNPDLKPYYSNNFEVSVERYFEPVGQISLGAFRKNITNYFTSFASTVGPNGIDGAGLYAGYTLTTSSNFGTARISGIEANWQQQFSFLPGVFKGLGAFANFTYLDTEGNFGTNTTTRKLGNLSPRSGNGGINFRYRGLDVRILANWTAEKYKSTVTGIDVYNEERLMYDLKLQYRINRTYDVFLDIANLTDAPPRTDVSLNGLKFFKTNQGVSFAAGVRGNF